MRRRRLLSLVSIAVVASVLLQVASALGGQFQLPSLHERLRQDLGLDPAQADRWVESKYAIGDNYSAFARGGDASRPPTISEDDAQWTTPMYIGFDRVQWMDPARLPGFPPGVDVNGALTVSVGGGPQLGSSYFVGSFVMGGDIPIHPPLEYHQQWDMVLSVPGLEPWIPLPQFPDDTWGQGTFVASLAHGSGPPTLDFHYFQDGSILEADLAGFGVIGQNTIIIGFEADPSFFGDPYATGVEIGGRIALDVFSQTGSRVVAAPSPPFTENSFFPYRGIQKVVPGLPGVFDPREVRPIVVPTGDLWLNLSMEEPWGPTPPTGFYSNYAQVGLLNLRESFPTTFWGFQTHAGIDEAFAVTPDGAVDSPGAFIMDDGSLMFATGMSYDGGPFTVWANGGFLLFEDDPFQGVTDPFSFGPDEVVEDDPMTFGGGFPVYDLVTGETIEPPVVTTTTMAATTTVVAQEPGGEAGGLPAIVWVLLVGLALFALFGGLYLARKRESDPCAELLRRWKAADARAERLRAELEEAGAALESQRAESDRLEAEVARLQGARGGSSVTMDGVTSFRIDGELVSSPDLDYRIATTRRQLDTSRGRETELAEMMRQLEGSAADADADAAAARAAYEECIGAAAGGAAGSRGDDGTDDSPPSPPTGTAHVDGQDDEPSGCSDPEGSEGSVDLRAGTAQTLRVYADFSVIVEAEEASVHGAGGEQLALDLKQLAGTLGAAGSLIGGAGAGSSIAGAYGGLRQGQYVRAAAGMARGTAEGVAATGNLGTDSFPIPVPTSLPEVVTGTLQVAAQLGALVATKVTEWMKKNILYLVRITYFYQSVTLTPVEVWECRQGSWHCRERLLEYDIGALQREAGPSESFKIEGAVSQRAFERYAETLGQRGAEKVAGSARKLAEAEERLAPGPCG